MPAKRFIEHLEDLRGVIIASLGSFLFCTACAAFFAKPLAAVVLSGAPQLVYTDLTEPFCGYVRIVLATGALAACPVICEIVRRYLSAAVRIPFWMTVAVLAAEAGSIALTHVLLMPFALKFFISASEGFVPVVRVESYLSLYVSLLVMAGFTLLLPCAAFAATRVFGLSACAMKKSRPYVLIGVFVIAAIVTPPDVISQLAVAAFLMAAYEAMIFTAKQ